MPQKVTNRQFNILQATARYGYVTNEHLKLLGIANTDSALSRAKKDMFEYYAEDGKKLRGKNHIGRMNFGMGMKEFYYLKTRGKKAMLNNPQNTIRDSRVIMPQRRNSVFTTDYYHRMGFVSCMIHLHNTCREREIQLQWERYYYNYYENRRPYIRISLTSTPDTFEPDAIFLLKTHKPWLFCLEYERKKDIRHIIDKFVTYRHGIREGQPEGKLFNDGLIKEKRSTAVLYVFETEQRKLSVLKRLRADRLFDPQKDRYFFKHEAELYNVVDDENGQQKIIPNFIDNWLTIEGKRASIL